MKLPLPIIFRVCLAVWGLLACTVKSVAEKPKDINGHGEPIPDDPLLAYVQRMQCEESLGPVWSAKTHFNLQKDTLCFPNDTFYTKGRDESVVIPNEPDGYPPIYLHRCFPLVRTVLQFHKFVRFDPAAPKLTEEQYVALIRHICRIPTWCPVFSEKDKLVVPGYKNLRDFSAARQYAFQQNIGWWLITYFRIGNWRMIYPSPKLTREWAVKNITDGIDHGKLQAVFMSVFPRMNHCVIAYDYSRLKNGDIVFWVYDPNYHNVPSALVWDAKARDFLEQKRWFFPGGHVKLLRMYISPIH